MEQIEETVAPIENKKDAPKKEKKFLKFLWKYKSYVSLILVLLIVSLWAFIKISILKSNLDTQKQEIVLRYELKLDSLNSDRLLLTAKTFSWAIRSELLRENKDQINQFFNEFVKNPDIIKLQLINSETSVVELSTDKKDEGAIVSSFNSVDEQVVKKDSTAFYIITPISGLNKKIGVFVMQIKNLTHE